MINYPDKFSLAGKKIVVTGGAGLIGRETVRALAQAGAHVVVADNNEATANKLVSELKKDRLAAEYYCFDMTSISKLQENVNSLIDHLGGIDVWINCAYPRTKGVSGPVEDISAEIWQQNVNMHLNSYALTSKYAAERMKPSGGSIINFASIYGVVANDPGIYENTKMTTSMPYSAIKGGIVNLARYLAAYFGKYNIRVNTICPGGVFDKQEQTFVDNYSKRVPLKRMANTEDVAPVALFLASDAAQYITGETIMVDGGWTAI